MKQKEHTITQEDVGSKAYNYAYVKELEAENKRLRDAIISTDTWADGYCIVCGNHTDRHSSDCYFSTLSNKVDSIKLEMCDLCGQGCEPERLTVCNNDQKACDLCREDMGEEDR